MVSAMVRLMRARLDAQRRKRKLGAKKKDTEERPSSKDGKRVLIVAKGFDVSVPEGCTVRRHVLCLESKLRDVFSHCGKIKSVCIPHSYGSSTIKSIAYIEFWGEGAREKALQLRETEMNGDKLDVTAPLPPFKRSLRKALKSAKFERESRSKKVVVKGYDTSLPRKFIKRALRIHFSSCGEVLKVELDPNKHALVGIYGEGAKDKALQLSGSDMGGFKLAVEKTLKPPKDPDIFFNLPPLAERLSNPNWFVEYTNRNRSRSRSLLPDVEKKEEEEHDDYPSELYSNANKRKENPNANEKRKTGN